MKIIAPGRLPQDKVIRMKCNQCGCVFEAREIELNYDQRDGDYYECPCPQNGCGARVTKAAK